VLQNQRCHFVHYITSTLGSAPDEDTENDASILDALDPEIGEISPMSSEEYKTSMKKYDDELIVVDQPLATQHVFVTMMELAGYDTANQSNPEVEPEAPKEDVDMDDARQSNPEPAPNPFPPQQDVFPPKTSRSPHGLKDYPSKYRELLVTPITLDRVN
jgi:hypothetical protein